MPLSWHPLYHLLLFKTNGYIFTQFQFSPLNFFHFFWKPPKKTPYTFITFRKPPSVSCCRHCWRNATIAWGISDHRCRKVLLLVIWWTPVDIYLWSATGNRRPRFPEAAPKKRRYNGLNTAPDACYQSLCDEASSSQRESTPKKLANGHNSDCSSTVKTLKKINFTHI